MNKVTMKSQPWHQYHRAKAAEFGDSVNQRVAVVPGDARSVQSAKKSMGPAAQLAVIAAVTSQRTNKQVTDMMITDPVAKVEPEGGINMLEALKVNKPTDVRAKRMQGERTITAKSEHKELLQNPFVFHFDLVSNTIEQCAGAREQDPVAFNTVCGVRKGVGVSYYSTLTPDRIDAIETVGRAAFGPNWKFSNCGGTDWIVVQRSQGYKNDSCMQGGAVYQDMSGAEAEGQGVNDAAITLPSKMFELSGDKVKEVDAGTLTMSVATTSFKKAKQNDHATELKSTLTRTF